MFGNLSLKPITKKPVRVNGWKGVTINPIAEKVIPLGLFALYPYNLVHTDSIYAAETSASPYPKGGLDGSLLTLFLRQGVAARLEKARQLLPPGCTFVLWDSYRTLDTQQALFTWFLDKLRSEASGDVSEDQLIDQVQRFVSLPSRDLLKPSPHNTGAAVDLGIIKMDPAVWADLQRKAREVAQHDDWRAIYRFEMNKAKIFREAKLLNFGTAFDEVSAKTATNYFEHFPESKECRQNRRLLNAVLNQVGFQNYEEEWWHFSYGDQYWGKKTGQPAVYGAATLSAEKLWWEQVVRRDHYQRNMTWDQKAELSSVEKINQMVRLPQDVYQAMLFSESIANQGLGDLDNTIQPLAHMI
ncbi:M15 family metallopeptidase [Patescibacteria group bacterium]